VPIAREELFVEIEDDFLEANPLLDLTARLVVSFEDKLCSDPAYNWVAKFARQHGYSMEITKSSNIRFHILEILGEDAEKIRDKLLRGPPIQVDGFYAVFSELTPTTNLDAPTGLNQLIYVTFLTNQKWVETVLTPAFHPLGPILRHAVTRRGINWFYSVLIAYNKPYFEPVLNVKCRDRSTRLELNYKSLAF
jgi:hypothetical protein